MMMVYLMCACIMGFFVCLALAFKPQETVGVTERLQRVQGGGTVAGKRGLRDEDVMKKNFVARVILPVADKISRPFAGITPKGMLDECRKDIIQAGLNGKVTPVQVTTFSWVLMILFPAVAFFVTAGAPRDTQNWFIIGIAALIGYRLPIGIIKGKAGKRKAEILRALPFSLDLISISVEAGVAFDGAMQIVAEKTKGPLTDELNQTLNEIRLGKGRNDALYDLGQRVGVDDLKSFLTAVIYISRLGGSLVDVIRIQAGAMRIKRRQRAEEKAMKTPVKIMIPLVLFIFPAMFVVILGPAGIQLMDNFAGVG